jgi:hypothetical protein
MEQSPTCVPLLIRATDSTQNTITMSNVKSISSADYEAVVATVDQYCHGVKVGSAEETAKAFHTEAIMYGFTSGGPISKLYDFVTKSGAAPNLKTRVDVLAITPFVHSFVCIVSAESFCCTERQPQSESKWRAMPRAPLTPTFTRF